MAYWWLRQGEDVISVYQFAEEKTLAADGYSALVSAETALLQQLATAIAATMVVTGS